MAPLGRPLRCDRPPATVVTTTRTALRRHSVFSLVSRPFRRGVQPASRRAPRVLILVENLSVPMDRRVWQESRALVDAGYDVVVICPAGEGATESDVFIEGVRILRYPLRPATGGVVGYVREYAQALLHSARLTVRVRLRGPIDVVQACNPPDLLLLVAAPLKLLGTRLVFDHHDLVPELFKSRFPGHGELLYRAALVAERLTFGLADRVISTNESYRGVATGRGCVPPDRVSVVRSAPDLSTFFRRRPDPSLRRGKTFLAAYLGVMGPQDGVQYALRAVAHLRHGLGRNDFHVIFMGSGDCLPDLRQLARELDIDDCVEFAGRVPDEFVQVCLSTADVGLAPDPKNPLNDLSTMNKIVEYMAVSCPVVSFDFAESRCSAGDAAVYLPTEDVAAFGVAVGELFDDPERRVKMGRIGRERVEQDLSWDVSRRRLLELYGDVAPC